MSTAPEMPKITRDRGRGQSEVTAPQRQHDLPGRARTALITNTPTPRVDEDRALLGEHGSPKAGTARARPFGVVRSLGEVGDQRQDARAATSGGHEAAPRTRRQAGQVNHQAAEERPDEQPDPVHPAERRHRPGPQPERHHLR